MSRTAIITGTCSTCAGSGEGMADGTTCRACKGQGERAEEVEVRDAYDLLESAVLMLGKLPGAEKLVRDIEIWMEAEEQ